MNKIKLLLGACFFSTFLWGQTATYYTDVPVSVMSAFEKMFPGAKAGNWEKNEYALYIAEFNWKGARTLATFNANGLLQRKEQEVSMKKIPQPILGHAKKLYPDHRIARCMLVTTPDDKEMYEVQVVKGDDKRKLLFNTYNEFMGENMIVGKEEVDAKH